MGLIILSFITEYLGLLLNSLIGGDETSMILFGISGFFVPTLFILDSMYVDFKNKAHIKKG